LRSDYKIEPLRLIVRWRRRFGRTTGLRSESCGKQQKA
jgi:hypothetical protein